MPEDLTGCDTFVSLGSASRGDQLIFAKNSDRPHEEAQPLELHERKIHPEGALLKTHFVDMPQASVTYRHVGSRPYWCWGYEMGFNEHQVVIGNEALQSKLRSATPTLTGMDLVRLGLERGSTATEAVSVITKAVVDHGQGKFEHPDGHLTYDNGFIVADPREAYVIETAGPHWAIRQVKSQTGISNVYSISTNWDAISPGVEILAREDGWDGLGRLSFAATQSEADHLSGSGFMRRSRSCAVLDRKEGLLEPATMMSLLADHADGDTDKTNFVKTIDPGKGICRHYSEDDESNTAASIVAELCDDGSRLPIYWTSMYSPCLGIFLPTFIEGELPKALSYAEADASDSSVWWMFHRLAKTVLDSPDSRVAEVRAEMTRIQVNMMESCYPVAREGRQLIDANRTNDAEQMLSEYMLANLAEVVATVGSILETYADNYESMSQPADILTG